MHRVGFGQPVLGHARDDFPSDQRRLMWRATVKG
jgi:hypothetical protein